SVGLQKFLEICGLTANPQDGVGIRANAVRAADHLPIVARGGGFDDDRRTGRDESPRRSQTCQAALRLPDPRALIANTPARRNTDSADDNRGVVGSRP